MSSYSVSVDFTPEAFLAALEAYIRGRIQLAADLAPMVRAAHQSEAGRRFVAELCDDKPDLREIIAEALMVDRIDPRLIGKTSFPAQALKALPMEVQADALDHGIPYPVGNDPTHTIQLTAIDMSRQQYSEVFDRKNNRIRTPSEIIRRRRASAPKPAAATEPRYTIRRDGVQFSPTAGLITWRELALITAERP